MVLNKEQIKLIEKLHKKAKKAELKARLAEYELGNAISESTGVSGVVNYLPGDGHGFTPESVNDTHIGIDLLIKSAKDGININEDFVVDNLYF